MAVHVGLDFDETVTTNPDLFAQIVQLFIQAGFTVSLVSIRPSNQPNQDAVDFADSLDIACFFTGGQQKAPFMIQQGRPVDIWIDDAPELIPNVNTLTGTAVGCILAKDEIAPDHPFDTSILHNHALQQKNLK
jgi:hypothetical protein